MNKFWSMPVNIMKSAHTYIKTQKLVHYTACIDIKIYPFYRSITLPLGRPKQSFIKCKEIIGN